MCKRLLWALVACLLLYTTAGYCQKQRNNNVNIQPIFSLLTRDFLLEWRISNYNVLDYKITPPIPSEWPPDGGGLLTYYLYVEEDARKSTDLYWISSPVVKIELNVLEKKAGPQITVMKMVKELGMAHAVRPQDSAYQMFTKDVFYQLQTIVAQKNMPSKEKQDLSQFFNRYNENNVYIGKYLKQQHPTFFKWLNDL